MRSMKQRTNSVLLCLFEILVGILLLINPVGFTSGIIITTGIVLLVIGTVNVVKYFREDWQEAAVEQLLTKGLVSLLAGGFCAFKSRWFIATFPVLTMIYGVVTLVTGLGKVQLAVDLIRGKNRKWFFAAISAAVSILFAVVIIRSPFTSTAVLWTFTGISLIVEAVLDVVTLAVSGKAEESAV